MAQWYVAQSTSPEAAGSRLRGDNSGRKMAVIVVVTMFKEVFRKFSKDFKMVVSLTVVNTRAWLYLVNSLQLIGEL